MGGCSILTARGGRGKTVPVSHALTPVHDVLQVVIPVFIADRSADIYPSEWLQPRGLSDIVAKHGVNRRPPAGTSGASPHARTDSKALTPAGTSSPTGEGRCLRLGSWQSSRYNHAFFMAMSWHNKVDAPSFFSYCCPYARSGSWTSCATSPRASATGPGQNLGCYLSLYLIIAAQRNQLIWPPNPSSQRSTWAMESRP